MILPAGDTATTRNKSPRWQLRIACRRQSEHLRVGLRLSNSPFPMPTRIGYSMSKVTRLERMGCGLVVVSTQGIRWHYLLHQGHRINFPHSVVTSEGLSFRTSEIACSISPSAYEAEDRYSHIGEVPFDGALQSGS